jgi:hypothetical protein
MFTFKLQVFLMRLFWRVKTACANTLTINHNLRSPFSLMGANTQKSNLVGLSCFSYILQIAKPSNLTQIGKRIVQLVSVNVVDVTIRHVAGHMKPCQPMGQSLNVVNGNRNVSSTMNRTSNFSNKIGTAMVFKPNKNAGLRVVTQRFAQMFNGNVKFGSHDIQFTIKAV